MKVIKLKSNPEKYSCNSYLVLGDWNKLDDVNTLVDTGSDAFIIQEILTINTGVGKEPIDRIILTHTHFDHVGGVTAVRGKFGSAVYAYIAYDEKCSKLKDGELLRMGDVYFDVIHTPGHSSDSICLYNKSQEVLFTGDTQIRITSTDGTYTRDYIETMERLAALNVKIIYPGHGEIIDDYPQELLLSSLRNIKKSKIQN
jgi:glyoxylase-like metal-dependent hydrolase (beta-lactamase superfamily II)